MMLDRDLAILYNTSTMRLNQAVKRNIERFPKSFMFQLNHHEVNFMVSQNVIPSKMYLGGHLPYAFTEQGVAMLSGVLKTKIAVKISIQIIEAFVSMRKFIISNAQIFHRLDNVDVKLLEHDNKFKQVFDAIQSKEITPNKSIFYDGQVFDAYKFVSDIIRSAEKSIVLIDNYVDDSVLTLFIKKRKDVSVTIFTRTLIKELMLDLKKYNSQYSQITINEFNLSHDRFLIIDNQVYHFGASLKDLGKKWFAFSKMDKGFKEIIVSRTGD